MSRLLSSCLFCLAVLAAACSGAGGDENPDAAGPGEVAPEADAAIEVLDVSADTRPQVPAEITLEAGEGVLVTLTTSPLAIRAARGDELLWDGEAPPLRIGRVPSYDPAMRYDPELLPQPLEWVSFENPVRYESAGPGEAAIEYEPQPGLVFVLSVRATSPGIVSFSVQPRDVTTEVLSEVAYRAVDAGENFYGLGESFDHVARRGTRRHMHMTGDSSQESYYNEAHFPIPLLISTNGSGIFVEDRHPGLFDVCSTDLERVVIRFSTPALKFHLLFAPRPMDVLTRYVELTGKPALPPRWAFGVLQWRNEVSGQEMVMDDAHSLRQWDIPASGLWVDRPFATAHESFVFDPAKYPDSKQMVKDLNALGLRVAIWSAPYLSKDVQPAYDTALKEGYFVASPDIQFEKFGKLVDFTNPGLVALWQSLLANATGIGIEGFKLDYGEDVVSGFASIKTHFSFFNGEGSETMHHYFQYFYHKTYRDVLDGDAFLINRAGCYGDQTITSVCWPGDLCSSFRYHGEDGHVGGLPAAVIGNQTLSVSGYPFFGSDTGGFRHFRPSKEVLLRWVAHTAFSPVLQFGGAGVNCNPWDFNLYEGDSDGEHYVSQFDEETVDIFRSFARTHIRLFPYAYTYAVRAAATGVPVTRPYGFVHPETGEHPDFEYFYGDSLVVAPVVREGQEREVLVPPGTWIDWFDRSAYSGPMKLTVTVPLDRAFVLVRQGAIIPLLRETVDTLSPATDPDVDSFADDPGELVVRLYPGADASSFECVLGPTVAMKPEESGHAITWTDLQPAFSGLLFEVDWRNIPDVSGEPVEISDGAGVPLEPVISPAEFETCESCYFFDGEALVLTVRPAAEAQALLWRWAN
jgi:alpha-D-xyloside xylohydrolase